MKKENKKISVVITTYNRAKYLEMAINSVLQQTYKNVEIIVIDDCSKDDTEETVRKIKTDKIKYFKNEVNRGCGVNRKEGVEKHSTGEYIIFLDDDDKFINKDYFKKAIKLFEKYEDLSMVCGGHIINDIINKTKTSKKFKYKDVVDNKKFFLNFGNEKYPKPAISCAIIKKEALEKTNYQEMKILNDTTIFLRVLLYGPMGFVNEDVTEYLVHGNNISFNCSLNLIIENLDEKIRIYKKLEKEKIFKYTESEKLEWLKNQLDFTIVYYINGSKPNLINFFKILKWYKKNVDNKERIKYFLKLYIKSKGKSKDI